MIGKLSGYWHSVHRCLFPELDAAQLYEVGELSEPLRKLVNVLDVLQIENFVPDAALSRGVGRPPVYRPQIARAFIAKAVLGLPTTRSLLDRLAFDVVLRRICGFERRDNLPSEATFSNAFTRFAADDLGQVVHAAVVRLHCQDTFVINVSRDSTAVEAREEPVAKAEPRVKPERPRGRPRKGAPRVPSEPTRLERQTTMSLDDILAELPKGCDFGSKRNSQGHCQRWKGYRLHLDVADDGLPLAAILTSASVNDTQAAIPLELMTASRVASCYSLMDKGYDARALSDFINSRGKVAVIKPRLFARGAKPPLDPAKTERYRGRTVIERVNGLLKDSFGGRNVRVQGHAKVMMHLMFGLLAQTAAHLTSRPV